MRYYALFCRARARMRAAARSKDAPRASIIYSRRARADDAKRSGALYALLRRLRCAAPRAATPFAIYYAMMPRSFYYMRVICALFMPPCRHVLRGDADACGEDTL